MYDLLSRSHAIRTLISLDAIQERKSLFALICFIARQNDGHRLLSRVHGNVIRCIAKALRILRINRRYLKVFSVLSLSNR